MLKSEKGISYINWVIIILVALILGAITIRVLVGENGMINQIKENKSRNETENNIVIELTDTAQ